ncbi:helicase C-terminal domain-containing protein [uncultured Clostridium sp.]|uniref:helicase C-terminal domain-containing protein n=1 Tax=uncultured Clostridium sp. TaxID=59620 RepID=UPI0025D3A57D|nr:helicase C-terminal domain-containing protein [uncultured Clostridium sp.]
MSEQLKSILDNVIYLDIETTGLDESCSEIIEIGAVKFKDNKMTTFETLIRPRGRVPVGIYNLCTGLKEDDLYKAPSLNSIRDSLTEFLEDLPLICHNGNFERKFFRYHLPNIKNTIMDSMELAAVLEPYHKEYNLDALMKTVTDMGKSEIHRGLDDSVNTMKVVNSLLCRLWSREERNGRKRTLYENINKYYPFLKKWDWNKHLLKPPFFIYDDYDYVSYEEKKKDETVTDDIKIDYKKYEELLKDEKIWNNGGDFGYTYRKNQLEFSKKIRENYQGGGRIFIEAPTGSGKTFAYVIIAAIGTYLNSLRKRKDDASFVISTNTKELQNQLIERDIPNILKKLQLDDKLKYGAMKGKANYICVEKLNKCDSLEEDEEGNLALLFFRRLVASGEYGDTENISYWIVKHFNLDKYFKDVTCDSDSCNLEKCIKPCYLRKRYNELPAENITVINHSLLACWPYGEKKKINHIIIDEGHNLMEKCYDFFCEEFSSTEFLETLDMIDKGHPNIIGLLLNLNASFGFRETIEKEKIMYCVNEIIVNINLLMNDFRSMRLVSGEYDFNTEFFIPRDELKEITRCLAPEISAVKESIYPLYKMLNTYVSNIVLDDEVTGDNDYKSINDYIIKLKGTFDMLDKFLEKSTFYAKILEIDNEYKEFRLKNVPLNVGELVNEHMLKDVKSTTFLSATLRIENSFNRMKKHLGQENAKEFLIPPVFDLKRQTKIFALRDMGRYDDPAYIKNISRFIYETCRKLGGHILVLFNNNIRRNGVYEELEMLTRGSKIEVHTNKKAISILNDKNRQVVILGTKGFFEGIDVPGDGLSCVMLDKLPNHSPEYPILRAVTTYQHKMYQDFNYPQLCIKVKQIYGRLVRSIYDYGYFIILDPGENQYTIINLQRDLNGPVIQSIPSSKVLEMMDGDYQNWKKRNLNIMIKKLQSEKKDIAAHFAGESKKHKMFWELESVENGVYNFKNMDYELSGKL